MSQSEVWTLRKKIVGVLLRQARLEAGKSLKECGLVLGVSSGVLSAIERGKRDISLPELELLAYYLGVPLDRFLNHQAAPSESGMEEPPGEEALLLRHRIIGTLVRQARLDRDLTQADLAKRVGIPKGRMSQYEQGEKPIPLLELEALAEVLAVPLIYFLDEGVGRVGKQQQLDSEWQQFIKMPDDVRAFVIEPVNLGYVQLAMRLSDVSSDGLRDIAASLLDITL